MHLFWQNKKTGNQKVFQFLEVHKNRVFSEIG